MTRGYLLLFQLFIALYSLSLQPGKTTRNGKANSSNMTVASRKMEINAEDPAETVYYQCDFIWDAENACKQCIFEPHLEWVSGSRWLAPAVMPSSGSAPQIVRPSGRHSGGRHAQPAQTLGRHEPKIVTSNKIHASNG